MRPHGAQCALLELLGKHNLPARMLDPARCGIVVEIDGLGWWPKAATLDYFEQHHDGKLPPGIYRTLTPGTADAWLTALADYGTMSFADVAQAAIRLAADGFPMYRFLAAGVQAAPQSYSAAPSTKAVYLPQGRPPRKGEMFQQKDLAATLRQLASIEADHRKQGPAAALRAARDFVYKGELAQKIVAFCKAQGGLMTMEDLAAFHVRRDPRRPRAKMRRPAGRKPRAPPTSA